MSDNAGAPRMEPITLPADVDVTMRFRDGEFGIEVTTPEGEGAPISRLELTTLFGLAIMSVGYNAHAQDLELE